METLMVLIRASRPVSWTFGLNLYAIGLVHSPEGFISVLTKPSVLLQILAVSVPLSLVVFGMNDVYDYETDIRNPRKTGLEGTLLDPSYHATVILSAWAATALILVTSLATGRRQNVAIVIILLVLSWQYSAPPLRIKEKPVFDSLSNGAIIDFAYLAGYTAGGGTLDRRMLTLKGHILSLCTAGVHALGAVVDLDADGAVGQRTIATVYGPQIALVFGAASYFVAFLIERQFSIFGVYLLGGLLLMAVPIVNLDFAHAAFRAIVYWTGAMSAIWFAGKAVGRHRRRTRRKSD